MPNKAAVVLTAREKSEIMPFQKICNIFGRISRKVAIYLKGLIMNSQVSC